MIFAAFEKISQIHGPEIDSHDNDLVILWSAVKQSETKDTKIALAIGNYV